MSSPSTSIYVRPGWTSYTWTYNGATVPTGVGESAITAVAFDLASASGQQVARGDFQYSVDNGRSWATYVLPTDSEGSYLPAAGTLWRFADHVSGDAPGSFTMHWKLADNSIVTSNAAVVVDYAPVGLVDDRDTVLSTLRAGDAVAALSPIDTGSPTGGRWVIDSQSQPGLFTVAVNPADGAATLVVANPAAMPAVGAAATVNMHYYDRYQLDAFGNPIAGQGTSDTLVYNVVAGSSQDLAGFGADLAIGAASGTQASPAMAKLSDGGFVTVWQGPDSSILAQLRDGAGNARGAAFALTSAADGAIEGEAAVTGLAGGRFVVAYTIDDGAGSKVGWRVVEANGSAGAQSVAGSGSDASMPSVATLADGSFVVGWRSGGAVHALQASAANGAALGGEQVFAALGSAFSPSVAALGNGGYAVAWGEIADGNVYVARSNAPGAAAVAVTADGAAASITTAAPLPHVATLTGGGFVVAWDSYSNDTRAFTMSDIFFQRYDDAGNRLGDVTQVNLDSGGGHFDATVAALADGSFVIGWQSQGGDYDGNGVFGRRFAADGTAIDVHEFEVNQQRQGDQASPVLSALNNGGFVAAWIDSQHGVSTIEARVLAAGDATGAGSSGQAAGSGVTVTPQPAPGSAGGTATPPASSGDTVIPQPTPGADGGTATVPASGGTVPPQPVPNPAGGTATVPVSVHLVQGHAGIDSVSYDAPRAGFSVQNGASGFTVTDNAAQGINDALVNVERVRFSDVSLALDIDGAAGQAFRLYTAAFERAPDLAGLGYWIKMMDNGQTLDQVAAGFVTSREFTDLYGADSSDARFVELLYQNVLHRTAEGAGFDYWMTALQTFHVPREQLLGCFSESAENQAQVIGSIQNGIAFTPWG